MLWISNSNPIPIIYYVPVAQLRTSQSKRYHMAQSVVKERVVLGIEPFWEKPTLEPQLRWERWQIMLKLAILAKEVISINTLREAPPDKVTFPAEPIYEENVENCTTESETDSKTRNEQLKNAWLIRCQKIELAGTLCGRMPWKFVTTKRSRRLMLVSGWKYVE